MTDNKYIHTLHDIDLANIFIEIAVAQQEAIDDMRSHRYNKLFDEMKNIVDILKNRPGDRRSVLVPLLEDRRPQVRLKAAIATLTITPAARATLISLGQYNFDAQALEAKMTLRALDDGSFVPN